jgi:hypothetical protein
MSAIGIPLGDQAVSYGRRRVTQTDDTPGSGRHVHGVRLSRGTTHRPEAYWSESLAQPSFALRRETSGCSAIVEVLQQKKASSLELQPSSGIVPRRWVPFTGLSERVGVCRIH